MTRNVHTRCDLPVAGRLTMHSPLRMLEFNR